MRSLPLQWHSQRGFSEQPVRWGHSALEMLEHETVFVPGSWMYAPPGPEQPKIPPLQ
jgi:hypothetical protein